MEKNSLIIISIFTILLTSCASALKIERPNRVSAPDTGNNTLEKLEFIGFDGNSSVLPANIDFSGHTMYQSQFEGWKYLAMTDDIRKFGQSLENAKIAKNNAVTYTGVYDASGLSLYESQNRYVSYIQVQKSLWTFDEFKNYKPFLYLGPGLLGAGSGLTHEIILKTKSCSGRHRQEYRRAFPSQGNPTRTAA